MARTESTMLPLGSAAPDFTLPDTTRDDAPVSSGDFADAPGLLVMFLSNHCPFVKHLREGLALFGREYGERGLAIVAISANDVTTHPADAPHEMTREAEKVGYTFPYLYDESQEVAKAYRAACTPDFFLFDGDRKLYYRGQFDDSRPGNGVPVTGADLRQACENLLAGKDAPEEQKPSMGCNVKWKAGNAPEYAGG